MRLAMARRHVEGGGDLSEALAAAPALADAITVSLVVVGERTGRLGQNLTTAARLAAAAVARRRRLRAAAAYPLTVVVLALGLAIAMTLVVLPRLAATFAQLGGELPWLTRALLVAAGAVTPVRLAGAVLVAGLLVLGVRRRGPVRGRSLLDAVPIVAGIRRELAAAVALEVVASLVAGGVPLVAALATAADGSTSPRLARGLRVVAQDVRGGRDVADAFAAADVLPPWLLEVLVTGSRTGALAPALARAAAALGVRAESRAATVTTVAEPLLIGVAGAVVGTVVLAVYLPLFRVIDLVR